jgi:hypothetical protein
MESILAAIEKYPDNFAALTVAICAIIYCFGEALKKLKQA